MKVEQVTSLNYLGVQITSSKDLTTEVSHPAIKASRISGCLNETIWSNKYLRTEAKVRIYKTNTNLCGRNTNGHGENQAIAGGN